jgi:hypothetical protein
VSVARQVQRMVHTMALYWCVGGARDGDGRVFEDRGVTDETAVLRDDSWMYGRGYYAADEPIRYVDTPRGRALVVRYIGERLSPASL